MAVSSKAGKSEALAKPASAGKSGVGSGQKTCAFFRINHLEKYLALLKGQPLILMALIFSTRSAGNQQNFGIA
jgi:hypothetical protein